MILGLVAGSSFHNSQPPEISRTRSDSLSWIFHSEDSLEFLELPRSPEMDLSETTYSPKDLPRRRHRGLSTVLSNRQKYHPLGLACCDMGRTRPVMLPPKQTNPPPKKKGRFASFRRKLVQGQHPIFGLKIGHFFVWFAWAGVTFAGSSQEENCSNFHQHAC